MFCTLPEAEIPFRLELNFPEEKRWRWVELSLEVPYLMLSFTVPSDGVEVRLRYLFVYIDDVLRLISSIDHMINNLSLGLFIPGHMNDSKEMQFGYVHQVWRNKMSRSEIFVMKDGSYIGEETQEKLGNESERELLISI